MSRVVVVNNLTLDGVMQSPTDWAPPYADEVMAARMAKGIERGGSMLFGRRTYEELASFWPHQPDENPYAAVLNNRTKYVASSTLSEPLPWANSVLLEGDVAEAVARLEGDITVLGSAQLVESLQRHDLIDEYVLSVHPLVLGSGRRLFPDGSPYAALRLVDSVTTTTGVVIATYRPAKEER